MVRHGQRNVFIVAWLGKKGRKQGMQLREAWNIVEVEMRAVRRKMTRLTYNIQIGG